MKNFTIIITLLAATLLFSCQNHFNTEQTGQLSVSVGGSARSILPADATITNYNASGTGPSSATIPTTNSSTGSFTFNNLIPGSWTINIDGLDAVGNIIASGSTTVTISTGDNTSSSVNLTPVTGTGTLVLSASWPDDQVIDSIEGTLTPEGGTATTITLAISGHTATYSNTRLATGSYILVIKFNKGDFGTGAQITESLVVYNKKTSTGTFALTASNFNPLKKVTYDANGGSGTLIDNSSPYYFGSEYTLLDNTFTKSGFFFGGWTTEADGSGYTSRAGSSDTAITDTTFYAKWIALPEMKAVPGGTFFNGTANMTVSSFNVALYDITQAQYKGVTGRNPSYYSDNLYHQYDNNPVECVTWFDAVEFCNKLSILAGRTPVYTITERTPTTGYPITAATVTADFTKTGYRLPTEAQLMWAAMGGYSDSYPGSIVDNVNIAGYKKAFAGSDGSNSIDDYAWFAGTITHEVGTKLKNELGLYDMSGNVNKWCWDWLGDFPSSDQTDYMGASSGTYRLAFGGDWGNGSSLCYIANRGHKPPTFKGNCTGIRVVAP